MTLGQAKNPRAEPLKCLAECIKVATQPMKVE